MHPLLPSLNVVLRLSVIFNMVAKVQMRYSNSTLVNICFSKDHVAFLIVNSSKGHVAIDYVEHILKQIIVIETLFNVRYPISLYIILSGNVTWTHDKRCGVGSSSVSVLSDTLTQVKWLALIKPLVCAQALPHRPVPGHIPY